MYIVKKSVLISCAIRRGGINEEKIVCNLDTQGKIYFFDMEQVTDEFKQSLVCRSRQERKVFFVFLYFLCDRSGSFFKKELLDNKNGTAELNDRCFLK